MAADLEVAQSPSFADLCLSPDGYCACADALQSKTNPKSADSSEPVTDICWRVRVPWWTQSATLLPRNRFEQMRSQHATVDVRDRTPSPGPENRLDTVGEIPPPKLMFAPEQPQAQIDVAASAVSFRDPETYPNENYVTRSRTSMDTSPSARIRTPSPSHNDLYTGTGSDIPPPALKKAPPMAASMRAGNLMSNDICLAPGGHCACAEALEKQENEPDLQASDVQPCWRATLPMGMPSYLQPTQSAPSLSLSFREGAVEVATSEVGAMSASSGVDRSSRRTSTPLHMASHLERLDLQDPRKVITVKKIHKLGFQAGEILREYFEQSGPVEEVLLSNVPADCEMPTRRSGARVRPSGLGWILMRNPEDAIRALGLGDEQDIKGAAVRVQAFRKKCRDSDSPRDS